MTVTVAKALITAMDKQVSFKTALVDSMREYGRRYPYAGYGGMFNKWLKGFVPSAYNSFGNGSAMRVAPCVIIAVTIEEALLLAEASAQVTHNHLEGIKGGQRLLPLQFFLQNREKRKM